MVIKQDSDFENRYTSIIEANGKFSEMKLDFGILKIAKNEAVLNEENKERAFLLIDGSISFEWNENKKTASRKDIFKENPSVLHIPKNVKVTITALEAAELAVIKVVNSTVFEDKFYAPEDITVTEATKDILNNTAVKTVRTVFNLDNSPGSGFILGEVINYPGKWSSYPPHAHIQPEVYHYRFYPENGFGVSVLDDEAFVVKNRYTCTIDSGKIHPQTSAPGYAMYYIYTIPHLPEEKWTKKSTYIPKEHIWLENPDAKIWPDA